MHTVMAFSNASRQRMSEGLMPRSMRRATAVPAAWLSRRLWSLSAFCAEEFGSERPSASMAEAIVFAVYMPPQEPGPGMAVCSTSSSCASLMASAARAPTASNTEMMSRRSAPGRIVPP